MPKPRHQQESLVLKMSTELAYARMDYERSGQIGLGTLALADITHSESLDTFGKHAGGSCRKRLANLALQVMNNVYEPAVTEVDNPAF